MIYVVPFHTDHIHDIMSADEGFGTLFDQQQFLSSHETQISIGRHTLDTKMARLLGLVA